MKEKLEDLALFGGTPQFSTPLHVGRPNLGDRERLLERWTGMLDRLWLTNDGPLVRQFEKALCAYLDVPHCVAVANATLGLQLLARALGLQGEIVLPSFTFVATAHAAAWEGLTPVFCDVQEGSHTLDPDAVRGALTANTTAILGVHIWGKPCDIQELQQIADKAGVPLLFDAAHAFGCAYAGRRLGSFGTAEVFSFHATKFVNSFEGGAITTGDPDLAERLRLLRNFGFSGYDNVVGLGTNAKMTEVAAAMGLTSLEAAPTFLERNLQNYRRYQDLLVDLPGLRLYYYDPCEQPNYQYVILELDPGASRLSRDDVLVVLHSEGVLARRYFYPGCHRVMPYRAGLLGRAYGALERTERLSDRVLALPTGTSVGDADIKCIACILRLALENPDAVKAAVSIVAARGDWQKLFVPE